MLSEINHTQKDKYCICGNWGGGGKGQADRNIEYNGGYQMLGGEPGKWEAVVKGTTYQLENKVVQGI